MKRRPTSNPKNRWPNGFSLVEIVITVAIISVLLSIAIPLLVPSDAKARRAGRDVILGAVTKARSHSITKGVDTALVAVDINGVASEYSGRRLALFEVKEVAGNDDTYEVIKQIGRWIPLPERVVMVDDAGLRGTNLQDSQTRLLVKLPGSLEVTAPAIVFSTAGAVQSPSGAGVMEIHLSSGAIANGNLIRKENKGTDIIEIGRLSGRAKIREDL